MSQYEPVIGMEVHVEINTASKVFCGCKNDFHAPPNTHVCPVCLGLPGAMPVMNIEMVHKTIAVGLALNCTISRWSKMDRKNYFYPDLPKNYQISQYDLPLAYGGYLDIDGGGESRRVRITRAHMEEDTARNAHGVAPGQSGVDFNRSGVPLLEIVTEPDLHSAAEAYEFLINLKQILEYLDVSDCNMEEGSLRAEANISVRPVGSSELGTKTEVKNVASFTGVQKAIDYEIQRQVRALSKGETITQETRGWDADRGITFAQRSKESAHDYRYFPEPDLPPIVVDEAWERRIRESLPELPQARCQRFTSGYGLSSRDARVIGATRAMADYFEASVAAGAGAKPAANWIMGDLSALLTQAEIEIDACKVAPEDLAGMIALIEEDVISGKIAKDVLKEMFASGETAPAIVKAKGWEQVSDAGELQSVVENVLAENPGPADEYRSGKQKAMGFLVGQVMKATQGKANPQLVNKVLVETLEKK
jgi:aspartyl-tRNA(Asn)/glutamyl-tRNA(Gln) amidotransferase subunit B